MEDLMKGILNKALTLGLLMSVVSVRAMETKSAVEAVSTVASEVVAPAVTEVVKPSLWARSRAAVGNGCSYFADKAKSGYSLVKGKIASAYSAYPKATIATGLTLAGLTGLGLYKWNQSSKAAAKKASTLEKLKTAETTDKLVNAGALSNADMVKVAQAEQTKQKTANIQAIANPYTTILTQVNAVKTSFDKGEKAEAITLNPAVKSALNTMDSLTATNDHVIAGNMLKQRITNFGQAIATKHDVAHSYDLLNAMLLAGAKAEADAQPAKAEQTKATTANTTGVQPKQGMLARIKAAFGFGKQAEEVVATKSTTANTTQVEPLKPELQAKIVAKIDEMANQQPRNKLGMIITGGLLATGLVGYGVYKYGINPVKWFVSKK